MLALLCSGQGQQRPDMFQLSGSFAGNDALFQLATTLLGFDPRSALRNLAAESLYDNYTGQLICALQALCANNALQSAWPPSLCVAGYSVGELAAWGVAGIATPEQIMRLVAARARAMSATAGTDQGMIFVRGLSRAAVDAVCEGREAAIAIINPADAWVIAGRRRALEQISDDARGAGAAHVMAIPVAVASHTALMARAESEFRAVLRGASFAQRSNPGRRLLSGIDGSVVLDVSRGLDKLSAQIAQPIDWAGCLSSCVEAGARVFLELGPGRALAQMAAAAYPQVAARSVDDFRSLEGVRAWVTKALAP